MPDKTTTTTLFPDVEAPRPYKTPDDLEAFIAGEKLRARLLGVEWKVIDFWEACVRGMNVPAEWHVGHVHWTPWNSEHGPPT